MMTSGLRRQLLIGYDTIFPGQQEQLAVLLKGLGRPMFLKAMSFFLRLKPRGGEFSDYRNLLRMFFSSSNDAFANLVREKLDIIEKNETPDIIIIQPLTCLQLFEYAFDFLQDSATQSDVEAEVSIFKAILLINQQNIELQHVSDKALAKLDDNKLRLAAMSLSTVFPYAELINFDKSELHVGQLVKSIFLFEFLASHEKTMPLLNGFVAYYDCGEWKNFLRNLMPLATKIIESEEEKYIDIDFSKADNPALINAFMDKLIVHDAESLQDYDFKKLRSAPFYKVGDSRYRIIFSSFVLELFHKGVYFKLNEINKQLPPGEAIADFRSFYCDEFSEKVLLYKLLQSIYRNKYVQFSGEQMRLRGTDAEPDYYIRNGNTVFLFESKDIFINATIKPSYDWEKYHQEFSDKLYFFKDGKKIKNKAVLQLIKNVRRVLQKEFAFDTNYKNANVTIYPVLVLHDHQFNLAGLNVLVNSWFQSELLRLKEKGLPVAKVRPLTIITIDSLIFHQDAFRDRKLTLDCIIDEYHRYTSFDTKKTYRTAEEVMKRGERTVLPFSLFLSNYMYTNKLRKVPKMITEKGLTLVNVPG